MITVVGATNEIGIFHPIPIPSLLYPPIAPHQLPPCSALTVTVVNMLGQQMILTPNNAGMFKSRTTGHRPKAFSELSYNTTSSDSDTKEREGDKKATLKNPVSKHASADLPPSGNLPTRRMTFGGLRSDKAGETYKMHRRPSFLASLRQKAVKVAEVATKATRRLSIAGNGGQGFALVAIGVSVEGSDVQYMYIFMVRPALRIVIFMWLYTPFKPCRSDETLHAQGD